MCLNTLLAKMHAAGAAKQMEATPGEHFFVVKAQVPFSHRTLPSKMAVLSPEIGA